MAENELINLEEIARFLEERTKCRPLTVLVRHAKPDDVSHGKWVAIFTQYSVLAHADHQLDAVVNAMSELARYLELCELRDINPWSDADESTRQAFYEGAPLNLEADIGELSIDIRVPQFLARLASPQNFDMRLELD